MTTEKSLIDAKDIVVGKPLPFSVYGADRMLLLAKGQKVESERVRAALIRNGVPEHNPASMSAARGPEDTQERERVRLSPLAVLRQDYQNLNSRSRFGLRMSREDGAESYLCWVMGCADRRGLIITAPMREDRSFVTVTEGQSWLFRTFYATAAFRFTAVVQKVLFEPFPYLHIQLPPTVDMRLVRRTPRAQVCINAQLMSGHQSVPAVIVDLSISGLRLGVTDECALTKDQSVSLDFTLPLLERMHTLKVSGRIMSCYGNSDIKHQGIGFYGLNLEPVTDLEQMVLHGYVQQHLAGELDSLWQALAMDSRTA